MVRGSVKVWKRAKAMQYVMDLNKLFDKSSTTNMKAWTSCSKNSQQKRKTGLIFIYTKRTEGAQKNKHLQRMKKDFEANRKRYSPERIHWEALIELFKEEPDTLKNKIYKIIRNNKNNASTKRKIKRKRKRSNDVETNTTDSGILFGSGGGRDESVPSDLNITGGILPGKVKGSFSDRFTCSSDTVGITFGCSVAATLFVIPSAELRSAEPRTGLRVPKKLLQISNAGNAILTSDANQPDQAKIYLFWTLFSIFVVSFTVLIAVAIIDGLNVPMMYIFFMKKKRRCSEKSKIPDIEIFNSQKSQRHLSRKKYTGIRKVLIYFSFAYITSLLLVLTVSFKSLRSWGHENIEKRYKTIESRMVNGSLTCTVIKWQKGIQLDTFGLKLSKHMVYECPGGLSSGEKWKHERRHGIVNSSWKVLHDEHLETIMSKPNFKSYALIRKYSAVI